ncbi:MULTISPECIES: zinc-binding dehydrogenase [unclassified Streptomyces]
MEQAAALVESGDFGLSVARTYSLSEAADAHRESAGGRIRVKLIIVPIK